MKRQVFIFKENNTNDRDCVNYIEVRRIGEFSCGHYFSSIGLHGSCFSKGLELNEIDFDNITTVLSKEDFEQLDNFNTEIQTLGGNINKGDDRYYKGIQLKEGIKPILDKLLSSENETLFEKVKEEEINYLEEEYNLSSEDIEFIFDNYSLDYRDRSIVGYVFNDIDELSREEAEQLGYVTERTERYFDYEEFGKDLLDCEQYLELEDGRIVSLMY